MGYRLTETGQQEWDGEGQQSPPAEQFANPDPYMGWLKATDPAGFAWANQNPTAKMVGLRQANDGFYTGIHQTPDGRYYSGGQEISAQQAQQYMNAAQAQRDQTIAGNDAWSKSGLNTMRGLALAGFGGAAMLGGAGGLGGAGWTSGYDLAGGGGLGWGSGPGIWDATAGAGSSVGAGADAAGGINVQMGGIDGNLGGVWGSGGPPTGAGGLPSSTSGAIDPKNVLAKILETGGKSMDWTTLIGPVISGALGLYGSKVQTDAAKDAANTTSEAARYAVDVQKGIYDQARADQAPWREAGVGALGQLTTGTAPGGALIRPFAMSDYQADPGYAFRQSEGIKALDRSASARGGLGGGAALKAVNRYGQDYASNEYGNAYNRYGTNQNNAYNRLASMTGLGQTANTALQNAGSDYGTKVGNLTMQAAGDQGTAQLLAGQGRNSAYAGLGNQLGKVTWGNLFGYGDNSGYDQDAYMRYLKGQE